MEMEINTSHLSKFLSCFFWAGLLNSITTALVWEDQRFFREKSPLLALYLILPMWIFVSDLLLLL